MRKEQVKITRVLLSKDEGDEEDEGAILTHNLHPRDPRRMKVMGPSFLHPKLFPG